MSSQIFIKPFLQSRTVYYERYIRPLCVLSVVKNFLAIPEAFLYCAISPRFARIVLLNQL
jgi:hypothetical protein